VEVPYRLAVNSAEAAVDAALAGLGLVRVLSYQVERELREGQLRAVLDNFAPPESPVNFVYSSGVRLPVRARAFIDWARDRLRGRLRGSPLEAVSRGDRAPALGR